MDEEFDFPPNKCGRRVDGGVDRISQLPDEIIIHILSFLSLRRAVTTSVLSSRWSDLWKHVPHLKLDGDILPNSDISGDVRRCPIYKENDFSKEVKRCKYIAIVNSVIQSYKAVSLKKFRILLTVKKSDKWAVTKWLKFVLSRQVESLELDFNTFFVDSDLVVLEELLREESVISSAPETLIFFQSLKILYLACLKVSGEDIELFLRNCPLLEQLTMDFLILTSDVEVCGAKLILKHLEIALCTGKKSIKVSAPNLSRISFKAPGDTYSPGTLLFESVPKLVEADFLLVGSLAHAACCDLSQLQILDLELLNPKEFWTSGFPKMPNLKKLSMYNCQNYKHSLLPVTALIWAYPHLEEFKLKFACYLDEDPSAWMGAIQKVERSPHQHLKVFAFQMSSLRYAGACDQTVELVTHILDNCVALQKIIIGSPLWGDRVTCTPITAEMEADAADCPQQIQAKVPHIQLEFTDCI